MGGGNKGVQICWDPSQDQQAGFLNAVNFYKEWGAINGLKRASSPTISQTVLLPPTRRRMTVATHLQTQILGLDSAMRSELGPPRGFVFPYLPLQNSLYLAVSLRIQTEEEGRGVGGGLMMSAGINMPENSSVNMADGDGRRLWEETRTAKEEL